MTLQNTILCALFAMSTAQVVQADVTNLPAARTIFLSRAPLIYTPMSQNVVDQIGIRFAGKEMRI